MMWRGSSRDSEYLKNALFALLVLACVPLFAQFDHYDVYDPEQNAHCVDLVVGLIPSRHADRLLVESERLTHEVGRLVLSHENWHRAGLVLDRFDPPEFRFLQALSQAHDIGVPGSPFIHVNLDGFDEHRAFGFRHTSELFGLQKIADESYTEHEIRTALLLQRENRASLTFYEKGKILSEDEVKARFAPYFPWLEDPKWTPEEAIPSKADWPTFFESHTVSLLAPPRETKRPYVSSDFSNYLEAVGKPVVPAPLSPKEALLANHPTVTDQLREISRTPVRVESSFGNSVFIAKAGWETALPSKLLYGTRAYTDILIPGGPHGVYDNFKPGELESLQQFMQGSIPMNRVWVSGINGGKWKRFFETAREDKTNVHITVRSATEDWKKRAANTYFDILAQNPNARIAIPLEERNVREFAEYLREELTEKKP